ncbi:FecR family protein [Pedobacter cryoconitis]|uniref:FecR family protein n=1 Tax=Pedobacter cryoconitis TaxID=188932 RepID=A0A327T6K2_9SPHI|nr:FecR domain-containing protein [Pedobacter cryoconitis]RAJ37210.1 FecR family protein [Pedobacter cryoconitis]
MKQSKKINTYQLEDFIADPQFISWVTLPDDALNLFWQQVQNEYPETQPIIKDARKIILAMNISVESMDLNEQQLLWESIELKVKMSPEKRGRTFSLWLRAAAAVLLLGIVSILSLFYYTHYQKQEISTVYGQTRTLALPDGTVVTLNANSTLKYPKNWDKSAIREVWIEGEAFFKVNHLHQSGLIKDSERFIVHAQKLNVEVLGTSFNVNNRRNQVKVALLTGKVRLGVEGIRESEINLQPGEMGEYLGRKTALVKTRVQAADIAAWKNGELHFDNMPLWKVLSLIEDNYGYQSVLKDSSIGDKRLSGTFSVSSEDALFKAIAISLGITIEKDELNHKLFIR